MEVYHWVCTLVEVQIEVLTGALLDTADTVVVVVVADEETKLRDAVGHYICYYCFHSTEAA